MSTKVDALVRALLNDVEARVPQFLLDQVDFGVNQGHLAVCVIAEDGTSWGRHFGHDRAKMRETSLVAWRKALQVWVTGHPTGEYERLVWSGRLNWAEFGIMKPDFIGWEGGLPMRLADGTQVAVAFSGFRGESDAALLRASARSVEASLI